MAGETVINPETAHDPARYTGIKAASTSALSLADELEPLVPVSLHGLARMQDTRTGLFSSKALVGPGGELINRGVEPALHWGKRRRIASPTRGSRGAVRHPCQPGARRATEPGP